MFIKFEDEVRLHPWTTKFGKKFDKPVKVRWCRFVCDNCGCDFSRKRSEISRSRLNENYKHFCKDCYEPALCTTLGHETIRQNNIARIGEKRIDHEGYVQVRVHPDHEGKGLYGGCVREHILVMEQELGRSLAKGEIVHHIDGNKTNNAINNLQVMTNAEHNNCHAKSEGLVFELYKRGLVTYDRNTKLYNLAV